jgi:hypothetical protein
VKKSLKRDDKQFHQKKQKQETRVPGENHQPVQCFEMIGDCLFLFILVELLIITF